MKNKRDRAELLMPAGSLEKLKIAILYGADSVYMGTPDMSLRSKSDLTLEEVVEGVEYAHSFGKKVYLTLNMFSHNKDIERLPEFIETVKGVKPDGLIIADPGVFSFVKERAPEIPLHISTQANVCSWMTVRFWSDLGAELCVLAREVSFNELKEIRERCPDTRLEAFIHGTMCMTYSGRCLLSNFLVERGANQGSCANSCRWNYKLHVKVPDGTVKELIIDDDNKDLFDFYLEEEFRPGEMMEIVEDERGSYLLNSKDLCIMPRLNEYLEIGVDTLKVEGRGKSPYYAAVVARAYRRSIDEWYEDPEGWSPERYMEELRTVANHGFTLAFHDGRLTNYGHNYEDTTILSNWEFAGIVREVTEDAILIEAKNRISEGDVIEFLSPVTGENMLLRIYDFNLVERGKITKVVHGGERPIVSIPFSTFNDESIEGLKRDYPPFTVIRKERYLTEDEIIRMELDITAQQAELDSKAAELDSRGAEPDSRVSGNGTSLDSSELRYCEKLRELKEALSRSDRTRVSNTPRHGLDGCCGRGCNGCLIFWHDPHYEKARKILKGKKIGEML